MHGRRNGILTDGQPLQQYDCNGSAAQRFDVLIYNNGAGIPGTQIRVSNTNLCIQSTNPQNAGALLKVTTCDHNIYQELVW